MKSAHSDYVRLYYEVLRDLQPLRSAGYLTTYNSSGMFPSAITVVGSGDARLDLIKAAEQRDLFFDAPLDRLHEFDFGSEISPMASVSLVKTGYSVFFPYRSAPLEKIQSWVNTAHSKGIAARFWGTPNFPKASRDTVWSILMSHGADWVSLFSSSTCRAYFATQLNADSMGDAVKF